IGAGETRFSLDLNPEFDDGDGKIHSGLMTIILDSIFGITVLTALEALQPIATINLRTDFLGDAGIGARAVCDAKCVAIRNDVATVRGALTREADGALLASAAGAFMVGTRGATKASRL
ncbi:MAG: PaaI family thioesterase, partial [Pseudomonadota bacterium]